MDPPLVTRAPLLVAVLALLAAAALAWPAASLRTENGLEAWLPAGDADRAFYDRFRADFGGDDFVVVAVAREPARDLVADLSRVAERLRRTPGVARVFVPVVHTVDGAPSLGAGSVLESPLLGERGAAAFVGLDSGLAPAERSQTLEGIEAVAEREGGWLVAGPVVINRALDRASRDEFAVLVPAAALGLLFVLILGLASLRAALAVLASAAAACGAAMGVVASCGRSLHMVLAILPAMLLVLGTSYALHPVVRYLDDPLVPGEPHPARLSRLLRETLRPALVAAATTAAGIGSLALADMPPVRDLGMFGAAGVLLAFVLAYVLAPSLLLLLRVRPYGPRPGAGGSASTWLARVAVSRTGAVLAAWAALLAVGVGGMFAVRVESNVLRLLDADEPVRVATAVIEDTLFGLTPVEIRIDGPRDAVFGETAAAGAARAREAILALPLTTHVISPFAARDDLRAQFGEEEAGPDALAAAFPSHVALEGDRASARMTVCSRTVSTDESEALAARVGELARREFPEALDVSVTGSIPLLVRVQDALVRSQVRSFAGAFVLVSLVLLVDLGSVSLAALSLVPNVAPAVLAAGALGLLGVPLDAATVAVAGIALGLAVDDTVHVLHRWKRSGGDQEVRPETPAAPVGVREQEDERAIHRAPAGRLPRLPASETRSESTRPAAATSDPHGRVGHPPGCPAGPLAAVFATTSRAMVLTSAAAATGFGCFAFSSFPPARRLGLLVAGSAAVALAADLLLLPALLVLVERRRARRNAP